MRTFTIRVDSGSYGVFGAFASTTRRDYIPVPPGMLFTEDADVSFNSPGSELIADFMLRLTPV